MTTAAAKPRVFNRPRLEAYIGATGSGKGVSINARLDDLAPDRLLIWDPRDEYGKRAPKYDRISDLVGAFKHARGGPVRARFVFSSATGDIADAFDKVCKLAFAAGNLVFLAEELSDVTKPSWAPPAWKQCITQGRHQALHLIGATQRPALIDKTFLGNATYIRCFSVGYAEDRRTMSKELDVTPDQVGELKTSEDLKGQTLTTTIRYLERNKRQGITQPGQIVLKRRLSADEVAEFLASAT